MIIVTMKPSSLRHLPGMPPLPLPYSIKILLRTSWVLGDREIFHIYPVLYPSILGYPFYPDSGTNFFQTTLEMSQPSSFPVSVIIIN